MSDPDMKIKPVLTTIGPKNSREEFMDSTLDSALELETFEEYGRAKGASSRVFSLAGSMARLDSEKRRT
jgi:hypothetical protein